MTSTRFTLTVGAGQFVMDEITADPRDHVYYTEQAALDLAAAQHRPVTRVHLDGTREHLGVMFDPDKFERAAYRGYVSHGVSMTDGHYAPLPFEAWVAGFRKHPDFGNNDAPFAILDALDTYKAHLDTLAAPAAAH
ncbi:hypothetical protein AB0G05_19455 [Nonomuraea wenchangensis]